MTDISLPNPLTIGAPENVTHLNNNLNRLVDGLNLAVDSGLAELAGLSVDAGTVRRGKTNIATEESRTNTAYGTLTTPDRVASVVLPTDGLIGVLYHATWKESVAGAARAAIFLGSNQLQMREAAGPTTSAAWTNSGTANVDSPLTSFPLGLAGNPNASGTAADATTGQVVGTASNGTQFETGTPTGLAAQYPGGPCYIFAAAGTYTVSVQFKASSGSVTAKNRKLWVWTMAFA